ncbi:effector-associated constant component EACC1 [Nocardia pseudovaccinii]|uniref:effector-associated constant component EACC1 n=1 Tax=Nocardia pseudovaccinii TaxID=189540 RepID=UPI0012F48C78|nr:hypothetical protein [Nocardia pseudovaccinii]
MCEFRLSISDSEDDIEELHDLYEAIREDYELVGVRASLVHAPVPDGAMGVEDVLRLVLDNPGLDAAVSTCVTAWLATRKSRRLKIIVRADKSVEIQADGIKDIAPEDVARVLNIARGEHRDETAGQ